MKNTFILILLALLFKGNSSKSQPPLTGEVEYGYRIFWTNIIASADFLSENERARRLLAWGNEEGYSTRMKLQFWPGKSLYTKGEAYDVGRYSWDTEEFIVQNDSKENSTLKYMDAMGKTYVIRGEMQPIKWQIKNELREILGHMCMKAETRDTLKNQNIVAWFAVDIPVSVGPEELYGLPGLILRYEVNENHLIVEAEKINFGEPEELIKFPKKLKGKEVTQEEYTKLFSEFIENYRKQKWMWAWEVRY